MRPIKHWFSKVVIPNAMKIESEAWMICKEIGVVFAPLPILPAMDRIGWELQFPEDV